MAAVWVLSFLRGEPGRGQSLDFVRYYSFNGVFLRDSLLAGEFPWWNPYAALGRPFATDLQTAIFYPGTWLIVFFDLNLGTSINIWLHLWLGGWGVMKFGKLVGLRPSTAFCAAAW